MQEKIKHIKEKVQLLVKQYQQLQKENLQLQLSLEKSNSTNKNLEEKIKQLQHKIDTAKISSSQLSKEEKATLEKRIDVYLKEINTCLSLINKD
jgi:lipid II:glycine glycyltransferase (peptidoglycan interpeptide bridge formation enzyme)